MEANQITATNIQSGGNIYQGKSHKGLWIGLGIGFTVGLGVGAGCGAYFTKKYVTEEARRHVRQQRRRHQQEGYLRGLEAHRRAMEEELSENTLEVDANDPEAISEAIKAVQEANAVQIAELLALKEEVEKKQQEAKTEAQAEEPEKTEEDASPETKDAHEKTEVIREPIAPAPSILRRQDGHVYIPAGKGKPDLVYADHIFFDEYGSERPAGDIRERLRQLDYDPKRLGIVWRAMGWGEYSPDPDYMEVTEEELKNMELNIDDEVTDADMERSVDKEVYLDILERYIAHPEDGPRKISRDEFDSLSSKIEPSLIDFYPKDNVFSDSRDYDNQIDGFELFGVSNGNDLFTGNEEDPDVVYVLNFKENILAEITRYRDKSYASLKDGSAFIDGNTVEGGGA